jgi:hypothetical protein
VAEFFCYQIIFQENSPQRAQPTSTTYLLGVFFMSDVTFFQHAKSRLELDAKEIALWGHQYSFGLFLRQALSQFRTEITLASMIAIALLLSFTVTPTASVLPFLIGSTVQDAFKHNRARQNVIVAGGLILVCITLLSCVSSFMIYRDGFSDLPSYMRNLLSLFAVIVVEGAFVWLVYGFTRAFSSWAERLISMVGMAFLVCVMLTNIITHFMMVKHLQLSDFQNAWLSWGAVSVFIAVLVIDLLIVLSDPVTRLIRLEMRYLGKQQETILNGKNMGLESEQIQFAQLQRAELEAQEMAERILSDGRQSSRGTTTRINVPATKAAYKPTPRGKAQGNRDWI